MEDGMATTQRIIGALDAKVSIFQTGLQEIKEHFDKTLEDVRKDVQENGKRIASIEATCKVRGEKFYEALQEEGREKGQPLLKRVVKKWFLG